MGTRDNNADSERYGNPCNYRHWRYPELHSNIQEGIKRMKNFAVAITRTCGSGGTSVAKILSEDLNIRYYDRMLLHLAADDSGINESVFAAADEDMKKSALFKAFKKVYNGENISPEKDEFTSSDNLFNYQAKVMKELVHNESFIVIGRGADFVLRDYPYLVRVFIHANSKTCLKHEMEWLQCDEKTAAARIERMNKHRNEYYKHFTGREWMDARNYDLCLDTSRYTYKQCAEMIKALINVKLGW